jgi:YD repeat-containing protein
LNPLDPTSLATQIDSVIVNGAISRTIFSAAAHTITEISPEGRQFVALFDTAGRVVEERAPGEASVKYTYGPRSLLTSVTQAGRTVRYDYDSTGRMKAMTDPLGRVERLAYDSVGRPVTQTLPNLTTILYAYDANGNLASLTPPGQSAHTFLYTSSGLDSIYAPPSVGLATPSTRFTYNLDGQLTQLTRPDSLAVQLRYDAAGRLDTLILPTGRIRFSYGAQSGQLMSMNGASGSPTAALGFTYDGSLPKASVWSGTIAGSVSAGYDGNLRLNALSVNGANAVSFAYDRDNLLTSAGSLASARHAALGRITGTTLGGMTSTVEVEGRAVHVATDSSDRSISINLRQIEDTPTRGRNPLSLVLTLPGVQTLSSNDYLGLATHPQLKEAIARAMGILEGPLVREALERVFRAMVERTLWSRGAIAAGVKRQSLDDRHATRGKA